MENTEIKVIEETGEIFEVIEPVKSKKGLTGGIVIGTLALVGAGLAAFLYKTKDKREAKKIEKLRQKGYVIFKEDEIPDEDFETVE